MSKFIKALFLMFSLMLAQQAFAGCWRIGEQPRNTSPLHQHPNGLWCEHRPSTTSQEVVYVNRVVQPALPPNAVLVPVGTSAPQGMCSWGDRFVNVGASAAIGAVIGALGGDTQRAAGRGAAAGATAGIFIPCSQQQQQVVVQGNSQQVVTRVATSQNIPRPPIGDYPCRFALNGVLRDSALTTNEATCRSWTDQLGAAAGGVYQQ